MVWCPSPDDARAGERVESFFRNPCLPFPGQRLTKPDETNTRGRCYLIWSKNKECVKHVEILSCVWGDRNTSWKSKHLPQSGQSGGVLKDEN